MPNIIKNPKPAIVPYLQSSDMSLKHYNFVNSDADVFKGYKKRSVKIEIGNTELKLNESFNE